MGDRKIAILHLYFWMCFAAQLPHGFNDLGHATAINGMIAAQPAAIGIERQFADAGNQIAVRDEFAAFTLLAEAQILQLHQDRYRETIVDRSVFDVLWGHTGLLEGAWSGPDPGGIGEVEILAAARSFRRLALPDQ